MPSFDVVSKTEITEVDNALAGMRREVETRFDFKGAKCSIERKDNALTILADDDLKPLAQVEPLHDPGREAGDQQPRAAVGGARYASGVGCNATAVTLSRCPSNRYSSLPVSASHIRTVLSPAPVSTDVPSGLNAPTYTGPVCPRNHCRG